MQLQQENQTTKLNLLRKCGLLAHTSPAFLKNCWSKKLSVPAARDWKRNLEQMARFLQPAAFPDAKIEKIMRLEKNFAKTLAFFKKVWYDRQA